MLARRSLARAGTIIARDPDSATYSAQLGHPVDVLTTDVVFALPSPVPGVSRDVILNISGLLWNPNPHVDFSAYRDTIRSLHNALVAADRTVTLLAHVLESDNPDNDVPAIREFVSLHAPDAEVLIPTGLDDVRSAVLGASVVIASRMHACLNALSVGTPAIPLAYSRKFEPLLRDLGWEHTVDLRTDADPAAAVMKRLADPSLERDVPEVVRRAHATLLLAEDALRGLA
jgi:polysaccharide pyruvyl transferase WcaK-like protein